MIELERHIEILLLDNDCVIVPGLGGFMAHHVDAHYDEEEQLFFPPLRSLGFNPKLQINDFLLAQSYIEAYDISYPEAVNRINDEVNELMQHLENEGFYELNDIGLLSLNEDGNYEFTPCEAGMLTPYLYGLSSFEVDKIAVPEIAVAEQKTEEESEVKATEQEEKKTLEYYLTPQEEEESSHIKIRVSTLRNAIAIAAVALAFFLISTPLGDSNGKGTNMSNVNTSLLQKIMPKEIVTGNETTSDIQLKKVETPVQDVPATEEKQETPQQENHYSLVLASCVSNHNAKAFVEQLKKDGYEQVEIIHRKNGAKVIYGSYKSEREAYTALKELHTQEPFKEAWVYYVKR